MDAELKTTRRGTDGRFLESVKICSLGQNPIHKLEHIYLVIARESGAKSAETFVRNEAVISLKPDSTLLRALRFDVELLSEDPRAKATHFLETRTAGASGQTSRAYYLRKDKIPDYVHETLIRTEHKEVRDVLRCRAVQERALRGMRLSPARKNRVSVFLNELLGETYAIRRTSPIDAEGEAQEDLLVCGEHEDPLAALSRMLYIQVEILPGDASGQCNRRVRDVIQLKPTPVVAEALRRDVRALRRKRGRPGHLLKLKPHAQKGQSGKAFYIAKKFVSKYVDLVRPRAEEAA